eukprot:Seg30.2 transcript_id=Seg30.2/GoldUCD/mRNA.D3Y31 product="hypothetical protein" protein_id=Seg30.2/GoldUCD/D3Y31
MIHCRNNVSKFPTKQVHTNILSPGPVSQATDVSSPETVLSPGPVSQETDVSNPETALSPGPVRQETDVSSPETVLSPGPVSQATDVSSHEATNLLTAEQRSIIEQGQPLSVAIVNAAMSILKSENKIVGDGKPFIQILQQNDSTWLTLSNVCSEKDKLTLYDTAQRLHFNAEDPKEIVYDDSLPAHALALSGNVLLPKLVIEIATTQQTGKDADTGVASIFSAVCLCRGLDPKKVVFQFKSLRKILLECMEKESFAGVSFNSSPKKSVKPKFVIELDLYCHCNMPERGYMVECPSCKRWYHELCESGDYESGEWLCKNCLKRVNVSHKKMHRKRKGPLDEGHKGNCIEKRSRLISTKALGKSCYVKFQMRIVLTKLSMKNYLKSF